jgi:hypothetical protein
MDTYELYPYESLQEIKLVNFDIDEVTTANTIDTSTFFFSELHYVCDIQLLLFARLQKQRWCYLSGI